MNETPKNIHRTIPFPYRVSKTSDLGFANQPNSTYSLTKEMDLVNV